MKNEDIKRLVEENLEFLQKMSVKEYILYQKWIELNRLYKLTPQSTSIFFKTDRKITDYKIYEVKSNIWIPSSTEDYLNIDPVIMPVRNKTQQENFIILRRFICRLPWNRNVGRNLRFLVIDRSSKKYLGVITIGSDFISVGGRDKYISWTTEDKHDYGMLRHTAMGSSIVPVQPFGNMFTGGKLISLLTCSAIIENEWNRKYEQKLVGLTTTSLYGGSSQYNGMNSIWRKCKSSTGELDLAPDDNIYFIMKDWYKNNFPEEYKELVNSEVSHPKARMISRIFDLLDVSPPKNNAPRGVYFCSLYKNSLEYLRREDSELGEKKFDNSVKTLTQYWKDKFASKRIKKLTEENRISYNSLFYDELVGKSWEEIREKYLED